MSNRAGNRFPSTHWTSIALAGERGEAGAAALAKLIEVYLAPLRAHLVLHRHIPADQADDLLQQFMADKVLERDLLSSAAQQKGRFRTFLLVALNRFTNNQLRNNRKWAVLVNLDDAPEPSDSAPDPSSAFEITWARQVLANAARGMRQDCDGHGRADLWGVFEARVLAPSLEGATPEPYEQLVTRLKLDSCDAAANLLVTAKRMFARNLRRVVGEYMAGEDRIDQEIRELRAILAQGSG